MQPETDAKMTEPTGTDFHWEDICRYIPSMQQEYWFEEGCFISEWSNVESDPECSIARARVLPGQSTQWHQLTGTTERYAILFGSGFVEIGDAPGKPLIEGDVVVIPPGVRQRIRNTGTTDLIFLAICTPRFKAECYTQCE